MCHKPGSETGPTSQEEVARYVSGRALQSPTFLSCYVQRYHGWFVAFHLGLCGTTGRWWEAKNR